MSRVRCTCCRIYRSSARCSMARVSTARRTTEWLSMYEAFYKLRAKPFALTPDPDFLYPSRHHQFAGMMLEYGILNQAGFFLLTGEVGSGKTLLVRHLLKQVGNETTVGLVANTNKNFGSLLQWVSLAFELPYRGK